MSGVKGRSGGARPNSGPPKKDVGKLPASEGLSPYDFLLAVMNNADADPVLRIRAATAAAKLTGGNSGSKLADRKRIRLQQGEGGKFDSSPPPPLKVVAR